MAKKSKPVPEAPTPPESRRADFEHIAITNNVFTTKAAECNEHTRAAVVALAAAAQSNADAITAIAKALKGGDVNQNAPMLNFGHSRSE